MDAKQAVRLANTINSRLRRALEKIPNSSYTNELQARIILMGGNFGLLNMTDKGPMLTRSKSKWAEVPEGLAEGILLEIESLGTMSQYTSPFEQYMIENNIPVTKENLSAFIEGKFNNDVGKSEIWDMAYKMRTQNQDLYDYFQKMFGNKLPDDWKSPHGSGDRATEELRRIINGMAYDDRMRPSSYGINQRKEELHQSARALGRALAQPDARDRPDELARLFEQFGQAQYGQTINGKYIPADYTKLSSDEIRSLLRKFLK